MKARVFHGKALAGILRKDKSGYVFSYLPEYLASDCASPIAYTFPLRLEEYRSETLFPFFQNLASEGWLLDMQSRLQKIDRADIFRFLLQNGRDLPGMLSIVPVNDNDKDFSE